MVGIADCVVVGVPDAYRGETVKAYVVLQPEATLTEADVKAFCAERLTAYKVPKLVEFRETLPRTMVGKVLRRVLVAEEREKARRSRQSRRRNCRMTDAARILVVDNRDSFVHNLVHYLQELGAEVEVRGNRTFPPDEVYDPGKLGVDGVLISPGPGRPEDAGLVGRPDPRLRTYGAAVAGDLPRPPGDRGGVRRCGRPGTGADPRQHQRDLPRGRRRAARAAQPVPGDPLPLARGRARTRCRPSSRSPRAPPTARSWACGTATTPSRACSSTRSRCSARTATSCWPTGCGPAPRLTTLPGGLGLPLRCRRRVRGGRGGHRAGGVVVVPGAASWWWCRGGGAVDVARVGRRRRGGRRVGHDLSWRRTRRSLRPGYRAATVPLRGLVADGVDGRLRARTRWCLDGEPRPALIRIWVASSMVLPTTLGTTTMPLPTTSLTAEPVVHLLAARRVAGDHLVLGGRGRP